MAGRADARRDVAYGQLHAVDEPAFEPAMHAAVGGEAPGIVAPPAVRVDRVMHGLRAVADIMAEANGIEGAMLFGDGRIPALGLRLADMAHAHHQPVVGFDRGIGQSAGPADIGARGGRGIALPDRLMALVERDHELIA
ncbi:hypothetical protein CAF53_20210 [Sphingobium sp. LB126]|nr:hypothetical protein CAF53_20210 [Sphingobium sp. LB126]